MITINQIRTSIRQRIQSHLGNSRNVSDLHQFLFKTAGNDGYRVYQEVEDRLGEEGFAVSIYEQIFGCELEEQSPGIYSEA